MKIDTPVCDTCYASHAHPYKISRKIAGKPPQTSTMYVFSCSGKSIHARMATISRCLAQVVRDNTYNLPWTFWLGGQIMNAIVFHSQELCSPLTINIAPSQLRLYPFCMACPWETFADHGRRGPKHAHCPGNNSWVKVELEVRGVYANCHLGVSLRGNCVIPKLPPFLRGK